jgi:predicted small integral membrane protein
MENNTTLLSDKQIVKAKLNTAADSFLPPVLYTCSLHAACQTCTNKKKLAIFFTGLYVYLSLVRLNNVSSTCLSIWNAAALVAVAAGGGPLFLSLTKSTPLGLAWLGSRPFPTPVLCSCRLLLSFVRRCLNAGLLCGGMRVLGV